MWKWMYLDVETDVVIPGCEVVVDLCRCGSGCRSYVDVEMDVNVSRCKGGYRFM